MEPDIQITIDCKDPHLVADFWAAALGYEVEDVASGIREILAAGHATDADTATHNGRLVWRDGSAARDPEGRRPRMYFQMVPELKGAKNRVHLDVHVGADKVADEVARLEALGARRLYEASQGPHQWVTMEDPEGNEFCVA